MCGMRACRKTLFAGIAYSTESQWGWRSLTRLKCHSLHGDKLRELPQQRACGGAAVFAGIVNFG